MHDSQNHRSTTAESTEAATTANFAAFIKAAFSNWMPITCGFEQDLSAYSSEAVSVHMVKYWGLLIKNGTLDVLEDMAHFVRKKRNRTGAISGGFVYICGV